MLPTNNLWHTRGICQSRAGLDTEKIGQQVWHFIEKRKKYATWNYRINKVKKYPDKQTKTSSVHRMKSAGHRCTITRSKEPREEGSKSVVIWTLFFVQDTDFCNHCLVYIRVIHPMCTGFQSGSHEWTLVVTNGIFCHWDLHNRRRKLLINIDA